MQIVICRYIESVVKQTSINNSVRIKILINIFYTFAVLYSRIVRSCVARSFCGGNKWRCRWKTTRKSIGYKSGKFGERKACNSHRHLSFVAIRLSFTSGRSSLGTSNPCSTTRAFSSNLSCSPNCPSSSSCYTSCCFACPIGVISLRTALSNDFNNNNRNICQTKQTRYTQWKQSLLNANIHSKTVNQIQCMHILNSTGFISKSINKFLKFHSKIAIGKYRNKQCSRNQLPRRKLQLYSYFEKKEKTTKYRNKAII